MAALLAITIRVSLVVNVFERENGFTAVVSRRTARVGFEQRSAALDTSERALLDDTGRRVPNAVTDFTGLARLRRDLCPFFVVLALQVASYPGLLFNTTWLNTVNSVLIPAPGSIGSSVVVVVAIVVGSGSGSGFTISII